MKGIVESGELLASKGTKNARYGDGQYFTDIAPEAVAALCKDELSAAQVAGGRISRYELVQRLFGRPRKGGYYKITRFVEIDVSGLNLIKGREHVFAHLSNDALDIASRIVRNGKTPFDERCVRPIRDRAVLGQRWFRRVRVRRR
ncbi:HYD1 signature containing ADP-ribosyltransferase family protein [Lentzea indica]|nr:HYD1 signature containing ADP-ribosyltransferase family protein [Lentzea indica]